MKLARSTLMDALTRLVTRSAEAANINARVAATFAKPMSTANGRSRTLCCTSAQADSISSHVTQRSRAADL